ncbi:MAG: SH3 domain-containing protein [Chloroflexota bacterium]
MFQFPRHITQMMMAAVILACAACNGMIPAPTITPSATSRTESAVLLVPTLLPTETPEPTATPPPSATPEPFTFPPTVTAPPSACEEAPRPTRLILQERGVVVEDDGAERGDERVNIREGPSTQNPVIGQLDIGDVFVVMDGPECSVQYAWFQIQFGETVGWIAEGDLEAYYVAPYFPG